MWQRCQDWFSNTAQTWRLKEKTFSRATFKMPPRRDVAQKALELHGEMSQAMAKGGKEAEEALNRVCVPKLSRSLVAVIDSRPKSQSFEWERVKVKGKPFWPRVVDYKWAEVDVGYAMSFRQAVVGIKSVQRLTELKDGVVVGKPKERELLEWVVLWAHVDKEAKTQDDWLIYGTLERTSYKAMVSDKDQMKRMNALMAQDGITEAKEKLGA